ncbi:MAG: hypothetical protein JWP81_1066 [Ferruginibacter sp.]|nr:hypothetical protein [Ferruginibacter sp.]
MMKSIKTTAYIVIVLVLPVMLIPYILKSQTRDTAHLTSHELRVIVANNEAYGKDHKSGYSGIAELYNTNDSQGNLFVPNYAGLNFEHIFSGDSGTYQWDMYETRKAPMEVVKHSGTKTELRQSRTKNWPLKSSIIYEVKNNGIDFTFSGIPLEDAWKKYGYIGLFFASYINEPKEKGIHFIGQSVAGKGDMKPRWIYHLPEIHGVQANHRPAGSNWKPSLDTSGFPISLVLGISDLTYNYPFYYGLSGENVFIMMFENPGKDAEIRFAQSPDGGGDKNPAWDFILYQKKYKVGRKFTFRGRAVYKKFEGEDDIIKTYEQWSGKTVSRPQDNSSANSKK